MASAHPSIKWGQKKDHILLTITVQDIAKPEINIEPAKLHFKGQQSKGLVYDTMLEFFDEINPQTSKYRTTSQNYWEFMLKKKDPSKPFWKRLTKSAEKCQWITTDWNHFTAEGDDDDEDGLSGAGGKDWGDLDGMFKQMGGAGGAAGLGNPTTDLNDLEGEETDSDDEPMPDLEEVPKSSEEVPKPTEEVPKSTEEVPKPTEEVAKSTEEVAKSTEEVPKPTEEVAKSTEEVPKPTEEVAKSTEETK